MKNLNELAKVVYIDNKKKGFHETQYSADHWLCLVISELMEAVEADRIGHIAKYNIEEMCSACELMNDSEFKEWFECTTKNTVQDEMADAFIRLLDIAGMYKLNIADSHISMASDIVENFGYKQKTFTESIYSIVRILCLNNVEFIGYLVNRALANIIALCKVYDIDLKMHINLKLRYNRLRAYKNGKLY